jgi:CheY-like chemotaxis protein
MTRQRILLIDDDVDYSNGLKEFLERAGYSVIVASNEMDGRRLLELEPIDLGIFDIWLRRDVEGDTSGLQLAKEARPDLPKIILTAYPSWETVRDALTPRLDGPPPAVRYISKEEIGQEPEKLLRVIKFALLRLNPVLKNKILNVFDVAATIDLDKRIEQLGPDSAIEHLRQSYDEVNQDLSLIRAAENRRAGQLHSYGVFASLLSLFFILVALGFLLNGSITNTTASLVVSLLLKVIGALFSKKEKEAHKRVSAHVEDLINVNKVGNIMSIVETLKSPLDRDQYTKKILDSLIDSTRPAKKGAKL